MSNNCFVPRYKLKMENSLVNKIEILRLQILAIFPQVPWPRLQEITYGDTVEELKIRADFKGHTWWDVPIDVLRSNYGAMAFFTGEAYRYYLPSYLIASLDDFDSNNEILMFTVFSLSPTKTDRNDENYSNRISMFNSSQREIIRRFLTLVINAPLYSLLKDAERGLKKFWVD